MSDMASSRRCLPIDDWPEADRAMWSALIRHAGPLDDPGRGAGWRPPTRSRYAKAYGRWLGWLTVARPALLAVLPAARITPETVEAFILALWEQDLAPLTMSSYVDGLRVVTGGAAPEADWLNDVCRRLQRAARPVKVITDRLRPADELFAAGLRLMDEAEQRPPRRRLDQSSWYRDGLMIALLAARPLRLGNLAAITLGTHLHKAGDTFALRFAATETKSHRPIAMGLPEALTGPLERYLAHHRPALLQGSDLAALWISNLGRPMHASFIGHRITDITRRVFGTAINPHAFRHCAATSIAITDPEQVHIVAPVLQHGSLLTGERHYNLADSVTAGRRHVAAIAVLRQRSK